MIPDGRTPAPDDLPQQQVAALRHGTVIDHLNPGMALQALEILGLPPDGFALLGIQLESRKMGRKDILKIENIELEPAEVEKLALLGSAVTVSVIKDFQLKSKVHVALPDVVERILRCPNPTCITNHEDVDTRFRVESHKPLFVRCWYCERRILEEEFQILPTHRRGGSRHRA